MAYRVSRRRWYLKKAARKGLAATAWASGWLAARRRSLGPRIRVLTYHRFGDAAWDPFCVTRRDFRRQMQWLADRRLAVSLDDLERFIFGERELRRDAVLVTADDGFRSVYTEMLPVLKEFDIPAVVYVSPSLIRDAPDGSPTGGSPAEETEAYLTWSQLEHLAAAGVVIGSHGWTHRSLGQMGPLEARQEAIRSREVLQQRLGCPVTSLAYPFGTRADFNHTTANILAETGYTTAFTSQHGAITRRDDPLMLPRIKVEGGEGQRMFRLLCQGAMDGWRFVDRALWRVQRAGR